MRLKDSKNHVIYSKLYEVWELKCGDIWAYVKIWEDHKTVELSVDLEMDKLSNFDLRACRYLLEKAERL